MKLDIAYRCQIGGRQENQDRVLILEDAGLAAAALVVADGLGGHQGGALASRLAAEAIAQNFLLNPDLEEEHLRELFCLANDRVLENQQAAPGMRSTAAALFYHQGLLAGGYIGDTRIYRFSQGKLVYQSPDHSVPQMLVYAGEILPRQIRFHPDRNRLLRALGGDSCRPQFLKPLPLSREEDFLLCTDGFWEYVLEEEMEQVLSIPCPAEEGLAELERLLLSRAPEDNDNYSALLLRGRNSL